MRLRQNFPTLYGRFTSGARSCKAPSRKRLSLLPCPPISVGNCAVQKSRSMSVARSSSKEFRPNWVSYARSRQGPKDIARSGRISPPSSHARSNSATPGRFFLSPHPLRHGLAQAGTAGVGTWIAPNTETRKFKAKWAHFSETSMCSAEAIRA